MKTLAADSILSSLFSNTQALRIHLASVSLSAKYGDIWPSSQGSFIEFWKPPSNLQNALLPSRLRQQLGLGEMGALWDLPPD